MAIRDNYVITRLVHKKRVRLRRFLFLLAIVVLIILTAFLASPKSAAENRNIHMTTLDTPYHFDIIKI